MARVESFALACLLVAACLRCGHGREIGNRVEELAASFIIQAPKINQGAKICPEGFKAVYGKCKRVFSTL